MNVASFLTKAARTFAERPAVSLGTETLSHLWGPGQPGGTARRDTDTPLRSPARGPRGARHE